jgi:holo-[acyl-carrier protein] synthase
VIIGFGSDLCDIRRIADALERFGARFPHRLFTEAERACCDTRASRAACYAKRFAAKEACAKALGLGFNKGVGWQDIGVVNLSTGQPTLQLTGGAAARLAEITPPGMTAQLHLTLSDEEPYAQALVLIDARAC